MRKFLWCGLAAVVSGVCGVGYYASSHPASVVGQCVSKVWDFSLQVNPVVAMTRGVLSETIYRQGALGEQSCENSLPDDPIAVGEAAEQTAGLLETNPLAPPPFIIPDQPEQVLANGAIGPIPDVDHVRETTLVQDPPLVEPPCPRFMPHCDAEDHKDMPYAFTGGEDDDAEVLTQMPSEVNPDAEEEMSEPGGGLENGSMQDYHHYHDYHSQYQVCPYSGKCVEITPPEPTYQKASPDWESIPAPAEEESEPKADSPDASPTRQRGNECQDGEGCPRHPEVDTMEFRPSDDEHVPHENGGPY